MLWRTLRASIFVLSFSATALIAQTGTGTIAGTVLDPDGQPLRHAQVSIDGTMLATTVDSLGRFSLPNVPSGRVMLRAIWICYRRIGPLEVSVAAHSTTQIDLVMQPNGACKQSHRSRASAVKRQ